MQPRVSGACSEGTIKLSELEWNVSAFVLIASVQKMHGMQLNNLNSHTRKLQLLPKAQVEHFRPVCHCFC
jgi:hypothetical protein